MCNCLGSWLTHPGLRFAGSIATSTPAKTAPAGPAPSPPAQPKASVALNDDPFAAFGSFATPAPARAAAPPPAAPAHSASMGNLLGLDGGHGKCVGPGEMGRCMHPCKVAGLECHPTTKALHAAPQPKCRVCGHRADDFDFISAPASAPKPSPAQAAAPAAMPAPPTAAPAPQAPSTAYAASPPPPPPPAYDDAEYLPGAHASSSSSSMPGGWQARPAGPAHAHAASSSGPAQGAWPGSR